MGGNTQDFELLMRIRADLAQATQNVAGFNGQLGETDGNVQKLSESLQEANARIEAMVQSSLDQANAQQQSNRAMQGTADQVAAVSRSYAQQTSTSSAATEAIATEAAAFNAAVTAKVRALQLLNVAFAGNLTSAEGIATAEAALDSAMGAGALTASEQAAFIERLAAAQAAEAEAAAAATAATNANSAAMAINGGVARELGVILGELARGNTARLEGSLVTLGNRTGLLSALFSPMMLLIAGVVAEFGVLAVAAEQVAAENDKTNKSLQATGNFAGQTTGSIDKMAASITAANGRVSQSRAVLDQLVASGKVSGEALQSVGQAAVDMAALTGESAEKATAAVLQIFDGTAASLVKANDQYHFLTTSIYDQITALEAEGDTQAAMDVAARAFHDAAVQRIQDMNAQLSGLARWWDNVKTAADNAWQRMKTGASLIAGTADDQTQLYALQGQKAAAQNHEYSTVGRIRNMFYGSGLVDKADSSFEQWTPEDEAKLQALQKKVQDATDNADQKSLQASLSSGAVDAKADLDQLGQSLDKNAAKQAEINRLDKDFLRLWKGAEPGDKTLDGVQAVVGDDGKVSFSGGLYDQRRAEIDKRYDAKTPKPKSDTGAVSAQAELIKMLNDEQGAVDPVAKAWAAYNDTVAKANALAEKAKTAQGADVQAINAERDAVIAAAATARDAQLDVPAKKAREAFEKLLQSIKDVNGLKLDAMRAQLQTLKDDLDKGVISATEYHDAVQGVLSTQLKPLPTYKGVGSAVGGAFGEMDKINVAGNELDKQYSAELAALVDANQKKLLADQDYVAKENALYTDYYNKKQQLQDASNDVLATGLATTLEQSANTVEKSVGKNTEMYRIAFAASKAAAIAQAGINLGKAISNAGADVPFPANIAAMAAVGAQMVALISQITSIQAGFSEGGYTGPGGKYQVKGYVHAGEGVLSQEDIAAMGGPGAFEAFRAGLHDGYADGGYVGDAYLPAPSALPEPRMAADIANGVAASNTAGGPADGDTHIHVWSIEEAAERLAESPTMQKAVVHIVGDNPRTIQGRWGK